MGLGCQRTPRRYLGLCTAKRVLKERQSEQNEQRLPLSPHRDVRIRVHLGQVAELATVSDLSNRSGKVGGRSLWLGTMGAGGRERGGSQRLRDDRGGCLGNITFNTPDQTEYSHLMPVSGMNSRGTLDPTGISFVDSLDNFQRRSRDTLEKLGLFSLEQRRLRGGLPALWEHAGVCRNGRVTFNTQYWATQCNNSKTMESLIHIYFMNTTTKTHRSLCQDHVFTRCCSTH
ncbi:uncharacterized protein LOC127579052 [Pristis pectinata]|uniref:uncharacterized protein LOC127579052 n=1 Tax=Pristis pectinata TaxID=685728 RepID=UPI00223D629D|nr:uncharacterized protein LOC127579052 [Pristis pectinata]